MSKWKTGSKVYSSGRLRLKEIIYGKAPRGLIGVLNQLRANPEDR
jgi:hypothetical protein